MLCLTLEYLEPSRKFKLDKSTKTIDSAII